MRKQRIGRAVRMDRLRPRPDDALD
jgi:hypothetical protein